MVEPVLSERLTDTDDPALWQLAITATLGRARADTTRYTGKDAILIEIGCCAPLDSSEMENGLRDDLANWLQPDRFSRGRTCVLVRKPPSS